MHHSDNSGSQREENMQRHFLKLHLYDVYNFLHDRGQAFLYASLMPQGGIMRCITLLVNEGKKGGRTGPEVIDGLERVIQAQGIRNFTDLDGKARVHILQELSVPYTASAIPYSAPCNN